jgi:hypothetical protein
MYCHIFLRLFGDSKNQSQGHTKDISDGRWEIYAAQKQTVEPITEFPPESYLVLQTGASPEELRGKAEDFLFSALKRRRAP